MRSRSDEGTHGEPRPDDMSDHSKIGWTDASWPVVTGCTHLSEGCDHCYAAKLTSGRLRHLPEYTGLAEHGLFNDTVRCLPNRLAWPLHWRKPRRIFVSDMADASGGIPILISSFPQLRAYVWPSL